MKLDRHHTLPIAALLMAAIAACSPTPRGVIPPDKMARLLADIHVAESIVEQKRAEYDDSAKRILRQSIFARYGYKSEQVDSSLKWYGYNTDKYVDVYERVINILEDEIAEAQTSAGAQRTTSSAGANRYIVDGDSVDVWLDATWRRFSRTMPSDLTQFALNADQHWERGDLYELSSRMTAAPGSTELVISAEYQDGSKEYNRLQSTGDGWKRLQLALNPELSAVSVFGYIRYIPAGGEQALADSISLVRRRSDDVRPGQRADQLSLSNRYGR